MSTNTRRQLEAGDTNGVQSETDPRPDYVRLGIDKRGAHHVYDTTTETVHIIHSDGSRGRRILDGGDVDDWMDAVASSWGWESKRYGQSMAEHFVDVVEVTDE